MSDETLTPQTEAPNPAFDPSEGNPFISSAADRSNNLVFEQTPKPYSPAVTEAPKETSQNNSFNKGVAATIIAATAVGAVGFGVYEANKGPEFPETTNEYVVKPGDGLTNAAEQVPGVGSVDIREVTHHIAVDPANIDVLKDGLQPGEVLEIPTSVEK